MASASSDVIPLGFMAVKVLEMEIKHHAIVLSFLVYITTNKYITTNYIKNSKYITTN